MEIYKKRLNRRFKRRSRVAVGCALCARLPLLQRLFLRGARRHHSRRRFRRVAARLDRLVAHLKGHSACGAAPTRSAALAQSNIRAAAFDPFAATTPAVSPPTARAAATNLPLRCTAVKFCPSMRAKRPSVRSF
jgi:hypothetical protein